MELKIRDAFIKLDTAMKLAGLVDTGGQAKFYLAEEMVFVNGEVETRRGRKLYPGDWFSLEGQRVRIL